MCDTKKFSPAKCGPPEDCPPPSSAQPCNVDFSETVKHFEIKISTVSVKYEDGDLPTRLTSLEYDQDYIYVRFVHPMLGRIETVPSRLTKTDCGLQACFKAEIAVHVRSDAGSFWNAVRRQEMAAYVFLKNQVFDEIVGVAAVPIVETKRRDADTAGPGSGASRVFQAPLSQPMPVPTPFCKGSFKVTVGIVDHGEVPHPKPPCGPTPPPIRFDSTKYFKSDLVDGVQRARSKIEKYYRRKATYRPAEHGIRKEIIKVVDDTISAIISSEMRKVVEFSEDRTLLGLRRIENALAECLRNAEDIREAVTCDETARGSINRIFEHLHAMYKETMDTNIRPSHGHLTYDTVSGLSMMQKLKGVAALKQDMLDQVSRLRSFVENEKPHELECFEKGLTELSAIHIPEDLREIFNGSYHQKACEPALRVEEPVEEVAYNFCEPGPKSMHVCP